MFCRSNELRFIKLYIVYRITLCCIKCENPRWRSVFRQFLVFTRCPTKRANCSVHIIIHNFLIEWNVRHGWFVFATRALCAPPKVVWYYPYVSATIVRNVTNAHHMKTLSVPRQPPVRSVSYGQRSFAYSAHSAWNALPQQVRSSDNVSTFRSRTKTHIFRLEPFIRCYLCSLIILLCSFIIWVVGRVGDFVMFVNVL